MPRHTHAARSESRSTSKPERGGSPRRQPMTAPEIDAQALTLREAGTSYSTIAYSTIARMLELERVVAPIGASSEPQCP